jgi:hypothetical protein
VGDVKRNRPRLADGSLQRAIYELEIASDMDPTLAAEDIAFVRNLRASPGGYGMDATWQLPSGLTLSGREIAELPDWAPGGAA